MVLIKTIVFFHLKVDCPEGFSVGFSSPKNSMLVPDLQLRYMVWIKNYPHASTNVEISCLNRNDFGIIKFIKILAAKSNSLGLKTL